ncbi:hypothetical protein [Nonomuraea sp. LPB2021202275-12-8]|uniref:hypothetical protein n=1 Tax=Nonomuraea sp. LPB2021202275-12-8 TaxID=3120159 RepID=UPI00300CFC45
MRVFALTFTALLGLAAVWTMARAQPVVRRTPYALIVAGVVGCVALAVYLVLVERTAAIALGAGDEILFAVVLAACAAVALMPPRWLIADRPSLWFGLGGALALGLALAGEAVRGGDTTQGVALFLLLGPPAILFTCSAIAATAGRSVRAGLQAAVWATVAGTLVLFVVGVFAWLYVSHTYGRTLLDGESLKHLPDGMSLTESIWLLTILPLWGLPFGLLGATWRHRRHTGFPAPEPARGS